MARPWEFWIDVGGTFTDCLARRPDGSIATHKLLSSGVVKGSVDEGSSAAAVVSLARTSDPQGFFEGFQITFLSTGETTTVAAFDSGTGVLELSPPLTQAPPVGGIYELTSGEEAPVVGIRWFLGRKLDEPIGRVVVRLGTTRGTNALLERQGARTALATTAGLADVLRIGTQNRPRLFDLRIRKAADLYAEVVEVRERIDSGGRVLVPLDESAVRESLSGLLHRNVRSLAVCLLNSYRNSAHELRIGEIAAELGFEQVSLSTGLAPVRRIVPRGETTVVDAYLTPIIRDYVRRLRSSLPEADLRLMTSAGGLVDAERFVGKDSVLSGPAGGVVGASHVAMQAGFPRAIGFDMGGTSTDVSRFDGEVERRYEMEVLDPTTGDGIRIVAPMLSIETVAAGGGSICWFDGQKTMVGPRSAGSNPGPACYGRGGPLCITDVNVYLGRILPEHFAFPLDRSAVEQRLIELQQSIREAVGSEYSLEQLAMGFVAVANANMAAAVKKISVARGYDLREYALVSFGGAGGQHACALAQELGISAVLQHPYAGLLGAFGIGIADVTRFDVRDVGRLLDAGTLADLEPVFAEMLQSLREELRLERVSDDAVQAPIRRLDLRYRGQDSAITVPAPEGGDHRSAFEAAHRRMYGFDFPGREVEVFAARLELTGRTEKPSTAGGRSAGADAAPVAATDTWFQDGWRETPVFRREDLRSGSRIEGPAVVVESTSTILIEPTWTAEVTELGDLVLRGGATHSTDESSAGEAADPIALELFNNRFASIAEQMGETLRRTALSTNVKERLDFSCAVFTSHGELVVNAPHIPVHLGAMGDTVRGVLADAPDLQSGDVFVTNDPYKGGSHLPDVTVVTPVFDAAGETLLFFTASRAHHAEIGGIAPGSMPPFSKCLAEEGVLIRTFRLVANGESREPELRRLLLSGPYPSRSVEDNVADVNAQVAANRTGAALLLELCDRYGLQTVQAYMDHIRKAAETKMRRAIGRIPAGEYRFTDAMDDGSPLSVTISIFHDQQDGSAVVDFTGTGDVACGNQNANRAIVRSAVLYCFRCLLGEDIPLNDGVLAPVTIVVPDGSFLSPPAFEDPSRCAAVVGGNVEVSQRVVDVVLGALGLAAASQGTMNNFLFGRPASDERPGFGYYETIAGGAGAGPDFNGADAVHTHMTNTRITDPEVLEARYPVRVRRFSIRRGSGGAGSHSGGAGVVREIEFLEPLTVSLLTNRRTCAPFGLAGGGDGEPGANWLLRNGETEPRRLSSAVQLEVHAGDAIRIETPGGGGFGGSGLGGG